MPTATATVLLSDRRYRLLVVRAWASSEEIEADPVDSPAARYVETTVAALAAYYAIDPEVVYDYVAGALWGMEHLDECYGCGERDYSPTCPSCQLDAGAL